MWTPASFRARWAEFAERDDATLTSALAEAARRCDPRLFGNAIDDAVALLAAHLLSISLYGQQAKLEGAEMDTAYYREWLRLARQCGGGGWASGQDL